MRKLSKTLLSLLLIAAMLASFVVLPAAAEEPAAEQPTEAVQAAETQATDDTSYRYNIVHVDAGRKYFSPTSIKAIIDNAAEAGFNQVELYLSDNQGFRFALDDMTVTTSTGNTYDLSAALGDGYTASDGKCPDGSDKYLTQSEMTDIIAYAKSKNVEIVPCVNAPGHMGAILEEFSDFRYTSGWQTSKSSIDLGNAEAVAFALAITDKYAKYFASQGCKYYNIGADEYANDLSSMGFENMGSALYTKFVEFMNSAADIIVGYGMTPRAFNDGFCYNKNEYNSVTVAPSKAYEICYWSSGWNGYNVASAKTLSSNGYKLINTNGDYYWVLGNSGWQCSANKASGFDYTNFSGNTKISSPSGSMFCIWCDFGNTNGADGGTQVVSDTADVIAAFGKALPTVRNNTATDENKTVFDSSFPGISVTGPNLTKVTVTETSAPTNLPAGVSAAMAWDIVPYVGEDEYHDTAKVTLPIPTEWTGADVFGGVIENGKVVPIKENLELDEENNTLTFTVPHFSTVMVLEAEKTVDIKLTIGEKKTESHPGNVTPLDETGLDKNVATVSAEYTKTEARTDYVAVDDLGGSDAQTKGVCIGDGTNWLVVNGSNISSTTDKTKATLFTVGGTTSGYSLKAGSYYLRFRNGDSAPNLNLTNRTNVNYLAAWLYDADAGLTFSYTYISHSYPYYVSCTGALTYSDGWEATVNATSGAKAYVKKPVEAVDQTVLTFTGVAEGTTSVKVGNIRYNITVVPENVKDVTPLTIEYWITNRYVSEGTTYNDAKKTMSLSATTAYKPEGVVLAEIVPATGTIEGGATGVYWKSRQLPSTDKQTHTSGVDKTTVTTGTDITRVRYWGKAWQYSSDDGKTWKTFESTDQVVAYYLQKTTVTDEIQTEVADWGENFPYSINQYVLVDYAVKLESGERVPDKFPITDKTQVFHCTHGDLACAQDSSGNYYRNIGYIRTKETVDYEVYMITLTPTSDNINTKLASNAYSIGTQQSNFYAGTEKVIWVDDEANLGDFADESKHFTSINGDFSYSVGGEPAVPGLQIYDRHGMLITYYVRTKTTEDSLTVHYIDKTANREFYFYNIAVAHGTYFDENIGLDKTTDKSWKGPLVNGEVTNLKGNKQTVSADLSTLPALSAQYLYSDYTCVEVTRSTGNTETGTPAGKEVYLYYTFNNKHTFVVDFGVPLKIGPKDINLSETGWTTAKVNNVSEYKALYGTAKISVNEGLTYTLTKPMQGVETLQVTLGKEGEDPATHTIYLVPATTVYYEQNVATYSTGWDTLGTIAPNVYQETQKGRTPGYNFGYDPYYEANQLGAGGSVMCTNTKGADATLTFKGTGMELYLRTQNANETSKLSETDATNHSYMLVQVYAGDTADANSLKRMSFVDVNNLFVQSKTGYGYNTPCWTVDGMTYGTYTVVVRYVKGTTYGLAIDGFRVTNTLNPDNATTKDFYAAVHEDNMQTSEIRNMVLKQAEVYNLAANWYKVGNEVIDAVYDAEDAARIINGAVLIKQNYDQNGGTDVQVTSDLVNIGPKNEIYLNQGEAVVMQLTGSYDSVQVGMRSLTGDAVTYKINTEEKTMNSTVDMYYKVVPVEGKLVIQNVSGGILALTKLKVTGAGTTTNDVSVETTPEAIRYAMALMRGIDVPQFTDVAEDAWYHDYVYDLVYRGVVNGMTATTYEPEGKLTRAQFVKLLACSLADAETLKTYEGKHPFKDSEGHWAEAYIAWAKDKGIVEGVSATEFDPEAPITREQMATIFGRYALKQGIELPKDAAPAQSFPDADKISEYAREFVELMRIAGILNGYEDGTFRPQGNATRAEAAKLFSLFLSITDKLAK